MGHAGRERECGEWTYELGVVKVGWADVGEWWGEKIVCEGGRRSEREKIRDVGW